MDYSSVKNTWKNTFSIITDYVFTRATGGTFAYLSDCVMRSGRAHMLLRPWFIIVLLVVLIHQISQKLLGYNFSLIDSFLDPLFLMPILLHLILWERRYIFGKGPLFILSWMQIVAIFIVISIVCEYLFPIWSDAFTRDPWDIVCYGIGSVVFGMFLNRSENSMTEKHVL